MRTIPLFLMLLITACGGGSGGEASKYQGYWYEEESDIYIEIERSGKAVGRRCSVHDGYAIDENVGGGIEDDVLSFYAVDQSFEPIDYELLLQGDELNLVSERDGEVLEFSLLRENFLPSYCDNDAVEITYYSPEEVTEGDRTTFIVNVDYRLASMSQATLGLSHTLEDIGHSRPLEMKEVSSQGVFSDSFMTTFVPVDFEGNQPLYLSVELEVEIESGYWQILASDRVLVDVIPNSNSIAVTSESTSIRLQKSSGFL